MQMFTLREIVEETGIPLDTVYTHIRQGILSVIKIGGSEGHTGLYLVPEGDCNNYKRWATEYYRPKRKDEQNRKI